MLLKRYRGERGELMEKIDFSPYIKGKTENFTGRGWVFQAINDWLSDPDKLAGSAGASIFLLTGVAGSGKSAVAARLAQMSDGTVAGVSYPKLKLDWLSYYHFCQAGLDSTLIPMTFVQSLSETLANRFPAFRTALESASSKQNIFNVNVSQNIGTIASGGQAIGVQIQIDIKGVGDARSLFDLAVRQPIKELCRLSPGKLIVILIDSLDEAFTFSPENNIAQLFQLVADFPSQVVFICTSRLTSSVLDTLGQPQKTLDLILEAPANLDEVNLYALTRLEALPEPARTTTAFRIAEKSQSNFLYAYHVLNDLIDLLARGIEIGDPDKLDLPDELEDVYRRFMKRVIASSNTKWNDIYRPLLGL